MSTKSLTKPPDEVRNRDHVYVGVAPPLMPKQYLLLALLRYRVEVSGQDLRAALKRLGYGSSNASFYELVGRMETYGWLRSRPISPETPSSSVIRVYRDTESGRSVWNDTLTWYTGVATNAADGSLGTD